MYVLIVDDDKYNRYILKKFIEEMNEEVKVIEVQNGKDAIDVLNEVQIDLVLTDIMMPVIDGNQLINYIRKKTNVKFIVISAILDDKSFLEYHKKGAEDCIKKPFFIQDVSIKVAKALV